jgi:hypothetical protein
VGLLLLFIVVGGRRGLAFVLAAQSIKPKIRTTFFMLDCTCGKMVLVGAQPSKFGAPKKVAHPKKSFTIVTQVTETRLGAAERQLQDR